MREYLGDFKRRAALKHIKKCKKKIFTTITQQDLKKYNRRPFKYLPN